MIRVDNRLDRQRDIAAYRRNEYEAVSESVLRSPRPDEAAFLEGVHPFNVRGDDQVRRRTRLIDAEH